MAERGRFITIEGGEGAGKSTQAEQLAAALQNAGIAVVTTREPGGSPGAEAIRALLVTGETGRWDAMTELCLLFAARRDHLIKTIEPALAAGRWVVCDRFADSTIAYQGYGLGLGREAVTRMYRLVIGEFRPDLTLILDLPVEQGLARARSRDAGEPEANRYERMDIAFHERLRRGFLDILRQEPERCVRIDASSDTETVARDIRKAVADGLRVSLA